MNSSLRLLGLCLWALLWAQSALALSQLSVVGSKFFDGEGKQFFVKGIAYQLTPHDPLINTRQCELDSALMKELGANAIRVYHVDPNGDHVGCMKAFDDAGIYLFVDLDDFPTQIEQDNPRWNETQLNAFQAILDEFQQFNNTAGVFVGNEVLRTSAGSSATPYVLAAVRDIKAYRDAKGYRKIPVGYSAADIAELRPMLQNYLVCRPDESERVEFFALNAYEWCGKSTFRDSGYVNLQNQAEGYPVPIFFSEVGCNTVRPRDFDDLNAILGSDMNGTWSGAMVYEWIQELNDYGLMTYGKPPGKVDPVVVPDTVVMDGFSRQGTPTPLQPEFDNLQSRFATLTPPGVPLSEYSNQVSTITPPPCPASTAGAWEVDPSAPLPSAPDGAVAPTGTNTGEAAPTTTTQASAASPGPSISGSSFWRTLEFTTLAALNLVLHVAGVLDDLIV